MSTCCAGHHTDFSINSSFLSSGRLQSIKGKTGRASPEGEGRGGAGSRHMKEVRSALPPPHPATHQETGAVSPLRLGLPEVGLCLPSDWGSLRAGLYLLRLGLPEGRAVSPLRLGLPDAGLCLPSDGRSLRQGCVSPQTGTP